jgi:chromosome segregation ATPase
MSAKPQLGKFRRGWRKVFGTPPDVKELLGLLAEAEDKLKELDAQLDEVREERLGWQAKEATTRKDLQDCQERSKELLEQVVQLTHKQRSTQQSLLDQRFKTETTPLERNRFEQELTEARGRAKRAEERAKAAEKGIARLKREARGAARVKDLESQLAWARRQSQAYLAALSAALEKLRLLEPIGKRKYSKPAITAGKRKIHGSRPQPSTSTRKFGSKHRRSLRRS